ncbi:hypothetical protein LGH70_07415 [Hymenobacter sp. BT635]|uniref:Immunity protein 63 domain-containing protein n=1 Tax=Hymenobacter nitidus TaxID=2880929 RepID=A0ABS8AAI9_9BACT|nr:hypothetical protein [Hymenobacter nitidus]MCB2377403.1 hypothetical protein [Hymenobacter nitidus]
MNPQADKLQQALGKGELFEYMVGENGYAYRNPYADMPTYPAEVFGSVVSYFDMTGNTSVWADFDASLLVLSADNEYSWLSLYYLVEYLRYSRRQRPVDLTALSATVLANLRATKGALQQATKWGGRDYPDGLWGDARRMVHNINEEHQLNLRL